MQNALKLLYPDQCVGCGELVGAPNGLCGPCWLKTPFIEGLVCDACGVPLLGEAAGARALCDACLVTHPPWARGRAALDYREGARRLVLGLKHGDRMDLIRPAAGWMAERGLPLLTEGTCLVPVPLHWTRLFLRRFNQAAALAGALARIWDVEVLPDALLRTRRTRAQERMTVEERRANMAGALAMNARRTGAIRGRPVLLVDDVMTSGATLGEASRVLYRAGASEVSVLALARVVKGGSHVI